MDHYALLGVQPDARAEEIDRAARHALWRPSLTREEAAGIGRAWFELRDPDRRRDYDAGITAFAPPRLAAGDAH